ncbi:S-adenosyl-L-methionine-dependent methyltransferase [Gilbertella persicaria]|uniref:S-adenosyl-L-methionine-dependent methyltransferase n=1 Tax=Gilbertella persicaria TaxID=101096 RepID=UPI002220AA8F|nr:S-adenosyl-L-methionine-dependent methyltransferase [Gilbertella persicaria]KAI8088040.1 S-adenosyl-L-methionine-dependent methyltransferase [Gilbertella persicaria]
MGVFSSLKGIFQKRQVKKTQLTNLNKKNIISISKDNMGSAIKSTDATCSPTTSSKQANSDAGGYNYKYSDGRRYQGHDNVSYLLPNDDDENDRIHQQHWILRYAFQCNFHAPVTKMLEEGITVLDSGCGPATWTFEIGESYPRSKIYGVDASCVFPEDIKPANVEFAIGNIAKRIPYEDSMFDYVHQRLLIGGLTHDDWKNTLKEHYRILKPGGYVELAEVSFIDLDEAGPYMATLVKAFETLFDSRGLRIKIGLELEDRLRQAGFENIVVKKIPLPFNHSGKIGELLWCDFQHLCINLKPALVKANPALDGPGVFDTYLEKAAIELTLSKTYSKFFVAYAQKPKAIADKN